MPIYERVPVPRRNRPGGDWFGLPGLGYRPRMVNLGNARGVLNRAAGSRQRRQPAQRAASFGIGAAAGMAVAAGVMSGRRALATARIGNGHPFKQRVLDLAAGALQQKYPLDAMSTYLNGFHMYADDMGRQVEATHFCIHLRHDLHQCVIFDRNAPDARLIGIEYIISEERFRGLPDDEKRLWHSHHYEVKSGILVAPGIPDLAEHAHVGRIREPADHRRADSHPRAHRKVDQGRFVDNRDRRLECLQRVVDALS